MAIGAGGILGTPFLKSGGFFGFDPTPNSSAVGTVRNMAAGNFTVAPDNNYHAPQVLGASTGPAATTNKTANNNTSNNSGAYAGDNGNALTAAQNNAYLDTQANDLQSLLGRTDTGLEQGLQSLNDSYQSSVNDQGNQERQALQDYTDKRVSTNKDKLGAYDSINKNANNGYRSLSQIIGRAAGTGSSAFQDGLPDAIGKGMSGQRTDANATYAENLGNIDTAQKKTQLSFQEILEDLANQRATQEQQLRTGVEQQRQGINSQLAQNKSARLQNSGASASQIAASQVPYQEAIDTSRNNVEGFFNQFRPTITPQQAAIAAPDLSQYTVDRANVNAQQQGAPDPTNPYADLLRKKLQEPTLA